MNPHTLFSRLNPLRRKPAGLACLLAAGCILCPGGFPARAQAPTPKPAPLPTYTINFKDGKSVAATSFRRSGADIVVSVQVNDTMAELSYPVGSIARIDFPEPAQLDAATQLVLDGKDDDALAKINSTLNYYADFKDVPGNWWSAAALVKLKALQDLHRDAAADSLISEMAQSAPPDSDTARLASVLQASLVASGGHPEKAMSVYDNVINSSTDDETLAYAWASKAASLYDLQKYEPAVLAYLHVPVFYPDAKLLMPDVLIGAAKCYIHIDHLPDAQVAFNDVIAHYPASPQADVAKTELKKIVTPQDAAASPSPTPASSTDASSTPAPGAPASPAATPAAQ